MVQVATIPNADLERKLPTESTDIAEIVRGILIVQARFAAADHRPLERGTHAKGVACRATFEVLDVRRTVADPVLASRLARGMFAQPGVYPATVRFANAASRQHSDRARDERALSFSVEMPPGVGAPDVTRLDYSMNSAPTFPLNDAHAFAVFMRVQSAPNRRAALQTLLALSLRELLGFFRTVVSGLPQLRRPTPYQQLRYWSTVPFRHGPTQAIKYSAIPSPANPAQPLGDGPNCLADELARHVNDDAAMSSFDFAVQFLDVERQTRWGLRRAASFWIENASVEWKESQSPFHVVGRLTLVPHSMLPPQMCEAMHIDVTENSTPDSEPLGSINRARWAAETASRRARFAGVVSPADVPPAPPLVRSRLRMLSRAAVLLLAAAVGAGLLAGAVYRWLAYRNIHPYQPVASYRYLDQGWTDDDRALYYHTAQGTAIHGVRYSWFINIERPFRRTRVADPDYLASLNFILDPVPTRANPDRLPVGFARRFDDALQDSVVDITCSACHSGELHVKRNGAITALRIDGGQAMHAFTDVKPGHFAMELALALTTTAANPIKFNRFANRVLGPRGSIGEKWRLWTDVVGVLNQLRKAGAGSLSTRHYPTQEGFGRTDALARINNTVFGDHLDPINYQLGDGPVSFPYLWNIWKFDWVQYNASVSSPMARNVGEAMGVGATFAFLDRYGRAIPIAEQYRTSVAFENLQRIESALQKLTPPRWPEDLLGPIDRTRAERGRQLFNGHCAGCHGPHVASDAVTQSISPLRRPDEPLWMIRWKALDDIGTDPNAAMNFVRTRVDLSRAALDVAEVKRLLRRELEEKQVRTARLIATLERQPKTATAADYGELEYARRDAAATTAQLSSLDEIDLRSVSPGEALNIIGLVVRERYYEEHKFSEDARACFEGFGMLDLPQNVAGYKPRPLAGVWATPPFLHNGSVPTLYDLLSPVSDRPTTFPAGTRLFDPVKVGYVTDVTSDRGFVFDTRVPGNRNIGHEFRKGYVPFDDNKPAEAQYQGGVIGPELTREQRLDLIEYLKIHRDAPEGAPPHTPPDCFALLRAER